MTELVSGHGRLIRPVPRVGHQDIYENDPIGFSSRPMERFVCRHEKPGTITSVQAGNELDVAWKLSAPHPGDCSFYISYDVDAELKSMRWFKVANEMDCWGKERGQGGKKPWIVESTFTLPPWLPRGRAVIRWEWAAIHIPTGIEFFIQCADVDITPTASEIELAQIPTFKVFSNGKPKTLPGNWKDMALTPNADAEGYGYSYRSEFNKGGWGNWPQFMTGPACAFPESKLNNCKYTAPWTQGYVPMDLSDADPVDLPEEDSEDDGADSLDIPEEDSEDEGNISDEDEDQDEDGVNVNGNAIDIKYKFYFNTSSRPEQRKTMGNIAGLLAQCMWESGGEAPWSACDENNYTNSPTASCTQRADGQLYASLGLRDGSDGSCAYDGDMSMVAETHAAWTPGPMKCTPGTVTEGCCWWGRGAIQTTGRYNYGHLQSDVVSKLGLDVDLCKNPEAMCQHEVLKMAGALYYWTTKVQEEKCFKSALEAIAADFSLSAAPAPVNGQPCNAFTDGVGGSINNGMWNAHPHGASGRTKYMQALVDKIEWAFSAWSGETNYNAYSCTGDKVIDTLLELADVQTVSKLDRSSIYNWNGFCSALRTFLPGSIQEPVAPVESVEESVDSAEESEEPEVPEEPVEESVEESAEESVEESVEESEEESEEPEKPSPPTCPNDFKYNKWDKCGGRHFVARSGSDWDCADDCPVGFNCYRKSEWYSQCTESCPDNWDCAVLGVAPAEEEPTKAPKPSEPEGECPNGEWAACGGQGLSIPAEWNGNTCCKAGLTCVEHSIWWSSCRRL